MASHSMKRPTSAISPIKQNTSQDTNLTTPTKKRPDKRLRFSDSVVANGHSTHNATGLTPGLRRATLGTPRATTSRASAPADDVDIVQFKPFREVLDDRCKRRISRNGLSKEINDYESEKKSRQALSRQLREKIEEVKRLQSELEQERSTHHTSDARVDTVQSRLDIAQAEMDATIQSFSQEEMEPINWDHVQIGVGKILGSDGGDTIPIYEDHDDQDEQGPQSVTADDRNDALTMGLELESARQAKQRLFQSTRSTSTICLSFEDSPIRLRSDPVAVPPTPKTMYSDVKKQLKTVTNRAEEAEVAMQALNHEVMALGFSDNTLSASEGLTAIGDHFREMRLGLERAMPGETVVGFENVALMPEMIRKLKQLLQQTKDREAELKSMRDQQRSLKGNFEHAIVAAEKASAKVKELEETIDSNAEEMLEVRMRSQGLEKDLQEKESNVNSLVTALKKYREDVSRLENLITEIEAEHTSKLDMIRKDVAAEFEQQLSDLDAKAVAEQNGRRAAEESAVSRLAKVNELDKALTATREQLQKLEKQLAETKQRVAETSSNHDEEVGALSTRIANIATALSSANAEVSKVKIINSKLEERYRNEVEQGALAIERIQTEFIRSVTKTNEDRKSYLRKAKVRLGNWELESDDLTSDEVGPMTPASIVRFVDIDEDDDHVEGRIELSRGKKHHNRATPTPGPAIRKSSRRRQYDSGIGMSSASDVDEDSVDEGLLTPELSSEADFETEVTA